MISRFAVAALAALVITLVPAEAGRWFVGLGYAYSEANSRTVGTTEQAGSYVKGAELRAGWEYDWYLGIEARLMKSFGESGATHSNLSAPSIGIRVHGPKDLSQRLFLTGGITFLTLRSNQTVIQKVPDDTDPKVTHDVTTYVPYPSLKRATWFVGGGLRFCEEKASICPRAEFGYRGSDAGGPYAGIGMDFRFQ